MGWRGGATEPIETLPQHEEENAHGDNEESEGTESDSDSDVVDPEMGVARRAMARPPVLQHCSAGMGRTMPWTRY